MCTGSKFIDLFDNKSTENFLEYPKNFSGSMITENIPIFNKPDDSYIDMINMIFENMPEKFLSYYLN